MEKFLTSRGKRLSLEKPLIVGILNVTPDSFSDGGRFHSREEAVERALEMVRQGADIIDIGGESTGPGSKDVSLDEELSRVMPVIQALRKQTEAWISVDTYKAVVASRALDAGADMINDVTALRGDPEMTQILKGYDVPVVLMYAKDPTPRTTREAVAYDDVVATVKKFLQERMAFAEQAGIARKRLVLDPGMGAFISTDPKYSLQLLSRLEQLLELGQALVVGPSRKSFIGQVLDVPLNRRLEGSLAACAVAVMKGASILRVHDVQETRRTVDMVRAIMTS
jgi:dihydropteroate synthase